MSRPVDPRNVTIQVELRCDRCCAVTFARFTDFTEVGPLLVTGKWSAPVGCACPSSAPVRLQAGVRVEVAP